MVFSEYVITRLRDWYRRHIDLWVSHRHFVFFVLAPMFLRFCSDTFWYASGRVFCGDEHCSLTRDTLFIKIIFYYYVIIIMTINSLKSINIRSNFGDIARTNTTVQITIHTSDILTFFDLLEKRVPSPRGIFECLPMQQVARVGSHLPHV